VIERVHLSQVGYLSIYIYIYIYIYRLHNNYITIGHVTTQRGTIWKLWSDEQITQIYLWKIMITTIIYYYYSLFLKLSAVIVVKKWRHRFFITWWLCECSDKKTKLAFWVIHQGRQTKNITFWTPPTCPTSSILKTPPFPPFPSPPGSQTSGSYHV